MTMEMIEIPSVEDYGKEKGIRGLMQIAEQSRDKNTIPARIEIITRYFSKFQKRMEKVGNPITEEEEEQIRNTLIEIVTRTNK